MKIDPSLGYIYIAEQTSPTDEIVKNMKVHDDNGIFYVEFEACLHSFDVMNRNSRMYKANNIQECLNSERIQSYLSHGGWFGERNHPMSHYKNMPLSPERVQDIDMTNTSHKMLNPHINGNLLISTIQTDSGTDAGMSLAKKMVQGFTPGFSCRAIASMQLENGKPVVNVRKIVTYDWVLFQSHREAEQLKGTETKFVNKSANCTYENGSDDVVISLKEILENVGKTDANTQTIMESFDLCNDNLIGFTKNNKQLIMKDNDNIIYCNINPESRRKVNDFFRSF